MRSRETDVCRSAARTPTRGRRVTFRESGDLTQESVPRGCVSDGEDQREDRAHAGFAPDFHPAPMVGDDALDDGEPEAGPAAFGGEVRREEACLLLLVEPRPGVLDLNQHRVWPSETAEP